MMALSKSAGLSIGLLPLILGRQRQLTLKTARKIALHLGCTPSEASYFELLTELNESESDDERAEVLNRMQKFQDYWKNSPNEARFFRYLSRWYYVAVYELADTEGFNLNPEWIRQRLRKKPTLKQIQDAVEFLLDNRFLSVDESGTIKKLEQEIDCEHGVLRAAMHSYHREMLEQTLDAIQTVPREYRAFLTHTFSIHQKDYQKIKKIIGDAMDRVRLLEKEQGDKNSIYHVSFSSFPMTTVPGGVQK